MDRVGKGKSVNQYLKDYCVLDLETTGIFVNSDKIIEISAIKVRDNEIVDKFSSLINPQRDIPRGATEVNGITNEMVKSAPTFEKIACEFLNFVGEDVILGYNNAGFDMNLLYDELRDSCDITFGNDYIDLLHASRRVLRGLENYRLETICKYYGISTEGEHRALQDCYLTKQCYDKIYSEYGDDAFVSKQHNLNGYGNRQTYETKCLCELQEFLEYIISDHEITMEEFVGLKEWMEEHRDLQGRYPFDFVFKALDNVLSDRKISLEELEELEVIFSDFSDPINSKKYSGSISSIKEKHIVVTGDFSYGSRENVKELIEKSGGIFDKNVTRNTNYVIVGLKGSDNWKTKKFGGKIEKAMELKDNGFDIEIVDEESFLKFVENNSETSDEENFDNVDEMVASDWIAEVNRMFNKIVEEYELPKDSLRFEPNCARKEPNKIISYSAYIWEPTYPAIDDEKPEKNCLVMSFSLSKARSRPNDLDLNVRSGQVHALRSFLPYDATVVSEDKGGITKIRIDMNSNCLVDYIEKNVVYCLENYEPKSSKFGCCSMFEECSNAKKCLHSNKLYSKACMYRKNLEGNRIFYGKNANF